MTDFTKINPLTVTVSNLVTIYQHDVTEETKVFLYKVVGYFSNVTVAEFRENPVETFKKYNGFTGIPEFQYPLAAEEICKLINWFDEDWAKANPAPEKTRDEFGRDLATREMLTVSLAAFCEKYQMYLIQKFVLEHFNMSHLTTARAIAEHVVKNEMYWQFLQYTKSSWRGDFQTSSKCLYIPWETGLFSKWTYDSLISFLKQWEPDELRQLVREAGWRLGQIGDSEFSKTLAFHIMDYAISRDLLTEVLIAAMRVRENP